MLMRSSKDAVVEREGCPFNGYGSITCDFGGCKPEEGAVECPTSIYNKCQSDEAFTEEDKRVIEETKALARR